jgi:ABC-type multidrug transport system fused ATPase/permease subunit
MTVWTLTAAAFGVRSSFQLHGGLLRSVLRAPMSFFDTTPTGRILSRFSNDLHTVDQEIADYVDIFVFIVLQLMVVMLTIVVITPFCKLIIVYLSSRCVIDWFSDFSMIF